MVVVGDAREEPVVAHSKVPAGQRTHLRLVKRFECIAPGLADVSGLTEAVLVDCRYYLFGFLVNRFHTCKDLMFQSFKQMRFQKPDMVFHCRLSFWLARRRGQYNGIVKILQIRECRVEDELVFCVFGYGSLQVIRDQILGDCTVEFQGVNNAGNKLWEFFVREDFGVDATAESHRGREDVDIFHFSGRRISQKRRMVTDPVDVHSFSRNAFHGHLDAFLTEVFL